MPEKDYEEFLESLNANSVKYLIVGAHALAFHSRPRATKDIDLYHGTALGNARRLLSAIKDFFGGSDLGFSLNDLRDPNLIVQLGVAPVRIDLLASLDGISSFDAAWQNRETGKYGSAETYYLSLEDAIKAKAAMKRSQDKADLAYLIKARKKKSAE